MLIWSKLCTLYLGEKRIKKLGDLFKVTELVAGFGEEARLCASQSFWQAAVCVCCQKIPWDELSFSLDTDDRGAEKRVNPPPPQQLQHQYHLEAHLKWQFFSLTLRLLNQKLCRCCPKPVLKRAQLLQGLCGQSLSVMAWWVGEVFLLETDEYSFKDKSHILHCMWVSDDPICLCGQIFSLFPMFPFHYYCFKFHKYEKKSFSISKCGLHSYTLSSSMQVLFLKIFFIP